MTSDIILLGHGSRAAEANEGMYKVMARLQERWPDFRFYAAFLEINSPSIPEGIDISAENGADKIILVPYFLHLGNHVQKDLPDFLKNARQRHPHVLILLGPHLGFHEKLVEIAEERMLQVLEETPAKLRQ